MAVKERILAVDDSPTNQKIIKNLLQEQYGLYQASSGQECLEMVINCQPDLILLDVEMAGLNGYETCAKLRGLVYTEHIPILFLSGHCTVAEKLKGYEVGGDDYITKPFSGAEVLAKIEKNLCHKEDKDKLGKDAEEAAAVALAAMGGSSYLGLCLRFLEQSFVMDNFTELARLLLDTTNDYGINCSVQLRLGGEVISLEADGEVRELEATLLSQLAEAGRYREFGGRAVINFEHISLLIKNMPIDDEARYGVIKDQLIILLQAAESRISSLVTDIEVKRQRTLLEQVMTKTRDVLRTTDEKFVTMMTEGAGLIDNLVSDLEDAVDGLDLLEYQEKSILAVGGKCMQNSAVVFSNVLKLDSQFSKILGELEHISSPERNKQS